jgi:hypothetical protein
LFIILQIYITLWIQVFLNNEACWSACRHNRLVHFRFLNTFLTFYH